MSDAAPVESPAGRTVTVPLARLHALEARVAELERDAAARTAPMAVGPDVASTATTSRRDALRLAGAAVLGALAATAVSEGAAAIAEDGFASNGGTATYAIPVRKVYSGAAANTTGFVFAANNGGIISNVDADANAALAGWAQTSGTPVTGVYGRSAKLNGYGVFGLSVGSGLGAGVWAEGRSGNAALAALSDTSPAVLAESNGHFAIVAVTTTGSGLAARGPRAALALSATSAPPETVAGPSTLGMIQVDTSGHLWLCIEAGDPGIWRQLGGRSVPGAFHAITPGRIYDSRNSGAGGPVATGSGPRTITLKDRLDPISGAVINSDLVPVGCLAITANVTVVDTVASGFLSVNPGADATVHAATANWSATGQILNNGVNLSLDLQRRVTLVVGGGGSANVVIDLTGYFL
jgi:hypothetical protein